MGKERGDEKSHQNDQHDGLAAGLMEKAVVALAHFAAWALELVISLVMFTLLVTATVALTYVIDWMRGCGVPESVTAVLDATKLTALLIECAAFIFHIGRMTFRHIKGT